VQGRKWAGAPCRSTRATRERNRGRALLGCEGFVRWAAAKRRVISQTLDVAFGMKAGSSPCATRRVFVRSGHPNVLANVNGYFRLEERRIVQCEPVLAVGPNVRLTTASKAQHVLVASPPVAGDRPLRTFAPDCVLRSANGRFRVKVDARRRPGMAVRCGSHLPVSIACPQRKNELGARHNQYTAGMPGGRFLKRRCTQ
jgi:hypothetical protein